jgi:hypothetical protein
MQILDNGCDRFLFLRLVPSDVRGATLWTEA